MRSFAFISCLCLLCCIPIQLAAQRPHHIFLSAGTLSNQTHDMLAAPVQYNGRGIPLALSYQFAGKDQQHDAAIRFTKTGFNGSRLDRNLQSQIGGHANYLIVAWSYSYRRRITRKAPLNLFAGVGWSNMVHIREYIYTPDNQEVSWDVLMSLGADLNGVYRINQGVLNARLHLPILSYVNRPPYALEGDEVFRALFDRSEYIKLGRFASVGTLRAASVSIGYTHILPGEVSVGIGYQVILYRYQQPRTTAVILQETWASLGFRL